MILPDALAPGLDMVFIGTAVSRVSRARGYPYANPGNMFWPILRRTGLVPQDFDPALWVTGLPALGLGQTDLCKTEYGNDADLSPGAFDIAGLAARLAAVRPAAIAFTSKHGGRTFLGDPTAGAGRYPVDVEGMAVFVLPSTSGQARIYWDPAPWEEAAAFVHARRRARGAGP